MGVLSLPGRFLAALRELQCSRLGIGCVYGHHLRHTTLGRDSVVIDAGANTGRFASEIAERFSCSVLAVEPVEELRSAIVPHERVRSMALALAPAAGEVELFLSTNPEANSRHLAMVDTARSIRVPATTVRRLVETAGGRVDLLKMDVEGEEVEILDGLDAADAAAIDQITVEFHDFVAGFPGAARVPLVLERMQRLGYRPFVFSSCRLDHSDVLFLGGRQSAREMFLGALLRATLRAEWLVSSLRHATRTRLSRSAAS